MRLRLKYRSLAAWLVSGLVMVALGLGVGLMAQAAGDGARTPTAGSQRDATGPDSAPAERGGNATTRSEQRRIHVFISGKVQGVGFRAFTQEQAEKLKVTGWVRNLRDGRVEAVVEGPTSAISQFIAKIKQGPASGRVDKVDLEDEPPTGEFKGFEIK